MSPEESLIDQYVTDSGVMFARLGDHLMTLDDLRNSHKHATLNHFGLTADPTSYKGNLQKLVSSHLERYDTHMGNYLRYAHVVMTYMVLEDRLHAFGQAISATHLGPQFIPKEDKRNGSLLDKFERYFRTLSLVPPSKAAVELLRLIRNYVVHRRGLVTDAEWGRLKKYLPNLAGMAVDAQHHLTLTTEACLGLQNGAIEYLRAINSAAGFHLRLPPEIQRNLNEHVLPYLAIANSGTS